jgi:DNA-binding NtrC family response regulator
MVFAPPDLSALTGSGAYMRMRQIIIVDDNKSTGVVLRKALEREDYQVLVVACEEDAIIRFRIKKTGLVMINQTCRKHSGWRIFNNVKLVYPEMPLMLYFLDNFRPAATLGVVQAAAEALRHRP